jgi:glycerol-3-phosphate acyltransferase PlsY
VATAAGILFAIDPILGAGTLATWLIIAFFFRYSSLAALISAIFAPFFYVLMNGVDIMAGAILVISVLLIARTAPISQAAGGQGKPDRGKKV